MTKTETQTTTQATRIHPGSCHCGAVRFEIELAEPYAGSRCNCSICTKTATTSGIVKPAAFTLKAGEGSLSWYEWGGKIARRFFCKHCGIQCFSRGHLAELGGDYVSVCLNAIDDIEVAEVAVVHWDGRHNNWYAGARPTPWPIFEGVTLELPSTVESSASATAG